MLDNYEHNIIAESVQRCAELDQMRKHIGEQINKLFKHKRPVIIVFREKHEHAKFACLNRNELELVCLEKLWKRYHMGYYCDFDDNSQPPNLPPISKIDIKTMPDGITKDAAIQEWEHYESAISWDKKTNERLKLVKTSLHERDGVIAFSILRECRDNEYEGLDIEPAIKIENLSRIDLLTEKPDWLV